MIDPAIKKRAVASYVAGMPGTSVSAEYGVSPASLYRWVKELGETTRRRGRLRIKRVKKKKTKRASPEQSCKRELYVIEHWQTMSVIEIAKNLKVSRWAVYQIARRLDLKRRAYPKKKR